MFILLLRNLIVFMLSFMPALVLATPSADDFTGVVGVTWDSTKSSLLDKKSAREIDGTVSWTQDVLGMKALIIVWLEEERQTPFVISVRWESDEYHLRLYRFFRYVVGLLGDKYGDATLIDIQGTCPDFNNEINMANLIRFGYCKVALTWRGEKNSVSIDIDSDDDRNLVLVLSYRLNRDFDRWMVKKQSKSGKSL